MSRKPQRHGPPSKPPCPLFCTPPTTLPQSRTLCSPPVRTTRVPTACLFPHVAPPLSRRSFLISLLFSLPLPAFSALEYPQLNGLEERDTTLAPFVDIGSGVKSQDLAPGSGDDTVAPGSQVAVKYVLRRSNGYFIDASYGFDRFDTYTYRAGRDEVIQGFDAAVEGMRVGGRRRFVVPPAVGYVKGTAKGCPGPIPPDFGARRSLTSHAREPLIFEVVVMLRFRNLSPSLRCLCTSPRLTHLDSSGNASMVDVSPKPATARTATAQATVHLPPAIHRLLHSSLHSSSQTASSKKGDVFTTAQLAGILAAKQTPSLIPLCHTVPLAHVSVHLTLQSDHVDIIATATTSPAQTGVEMEALTAASVAALTVYDMCKAGGKGMKISVWLKSKAGGQGGDWTA